MHYGSTEIGKLYHGPTEIKEAWTHDGAWRQVFSSAPPLIASRVDRTANTQQFPPRNVWTEVLWSSSAGDPLVGNAIEVSGAGQAVIAGEITHSATGNAANLMSWRIAVDIGYVAQWKSALSAIKTSIPPTTVTLKPGDRVRLEVYGPAIADGERYVYRPSFMTITPV